MAKQQDKDWRQSVIEMSPRMEATTEQATGGFTPATAADFGPVTFHGDRTPYDPAVLLDGRPLDKWTWIDQRHADLFSQIPTFEQEQEVRLETLGYKNRIGDLTRHQSEGGFGLPQDAPQVRAERKKLERAEKELARVTELKETRTVRSTATGQLRQSVNDWVLRGIPTDCVLDVVSDAPVAELLKKNETLSDGVERYRLRQRECDADAHRVRSQQWPVSVGEADAVDLIARRGDAGRPNLENAIEHGQPISFATTRLSGLVHNVDARGAIAFIESEDAIGLICWLFGPELLKKISGGFREIADGDALDERQRAEMLATISADRLAAERAECSLIWAAAERGEILDFRADTTPMCAIGVALRTVPRAEPSGTSYGHAWDLAGGRQR
ncbi:hypothetical protein [Bradyrhizobium sp. 2S1]|uniref:hypothetical protein n=1 Tax=Bradyrhizobium sp. 2S1 TaxID=1404429 RepID=UPI0014074972|nr:hypothetical protein [Bradyrhizobium sp. 2S1]MCK7665690.1 hypothetical protein [Bradyrhizobium sp. 2S1]